MSRESVASYFRLLWQQYSYQLPLVSGSLAALVVEAALASSWSTWRLVPQLLVGACLLYFVTSTLAVHRSFFPHPMVAYAVSVGKSREMFESSARRQQEARLKQSGIRWDAVQREFRIHSADWAFIDESTLSSDSESWVELTRRMLLHFWNLPKRVEGVPVFHIFLMVPPTVAFALGAHVGRKVAYVLYHFVHSAKQPYIPVADTSHRDTSQGFVELNRRIAPADYAHIVVAQEPKNSTGSKGILVLDFTNHKLGGHFPDEADATEIVRVGHKNGIGHLPSSDWERLAHEIASVILGYCDHGRRLDLWVNCPLPLAFLIGAIVGPVDGLTLCEHNVYLQEKIRCFDLTDQRIQGLSSPFAARRGDLAA